MITIATSRSPDEPLRLVEVPNRSLGARDVRVRVGAIGVNPVDWKMRSGGPLRLAHRFVGPSGPLVVGVDFAGEVVEVGPNADLLVGTRVVGGTDFSRKQLGSYANEVVVRDEQCAKLPDSVSYEDAACLPVPGATALRAFEVAKLFTPCQGHSVDAERTDRPSAFGASRPSSESAPRVLVLGASGGVGLMTVQLAHAKSAKVVGVCSSRNVALVEKKGAVAIDYTKGDALEAARPHGPFDLVVHAVGTATYSLKTCRSLLSRAGVVALAVVRPSDWWSMLVRRSVHAILGRPNRANLEPLVASVVRGEIECLVEARFPLAEAERAHALSRSGKVVGKLLLLP